MEVTAAAAITAMERNERRQTVESVTGAGLNRAEAWRKARSASVGSVKCVPHLPPCPFGLCFTDTPKLPAWA